MPKESSTLELPVNGTNGHSTAEIVVPDEVSTSEIAARERAIVGNGQLGWTPGFRSSSKPERALKVARRYTKSGQDPFETSEWEKRVAAITGETGKSVFEQKECEIPKNWSQLATNVVVSKYFRGPMDSPQRETSVRQVIGRVSDTIGNWGREGGYFASDEDASAFRDELTYLLLHQYGAFNSPVWFNLGVKGSRAQASACFINSVHDDMESIMELAATEARLFKGGSGAGSNLWRIRSSKEQLSGGGVASGPVSFMRGWDAFAGAIKSGGTTRRAAKMVVLNADHPDIEEFITCKSTEEKKAWALIEAGYSGGWNVPGGAYDSVMFQNANHSVRVSDEFMRAAENNQNWETRAVTSGKVVETKNAREMLLKIAECTHLCGDPGLQYDTIINDWHTCSGTDRIYASNPCSEFVFLDDTACNLSSLNLLKFYDFETGHFDAEAYVHACEVFLTAQEIIVSFASYPTKKIAENSELYRPLGLGYCNIGALLMAMGLAYDSDQGRAFAGALTAIMTGSAYAQSARIAANVGPFEGYAKNKEPMLRVIGKHRDSVKRIDGSLVADNVMSSAQKVWDDALMLGQKHGYRNAQTTVLAPTGTISFMMDADTTGIEPDIALVKYKKLVGGGLLKIVNQTVPAALRKLSYNEDEIKSIVDYIDKNDTIEGAPGLLDEHISVFDCAFKAMNGTRSIHHMGHIKMMAAAQPFLSGAISKTVNMPESCTVEEIMDAYIQSWKLGTKAVAIYRDNSKRTQPLSTASDAQKADKKEADVKRANRRKLPDERNSVTHKFSIAGQEGYFMVGLYEDGSPGELFIKMSKEGSTISGLMDSFAVSISLCLQYGVPLRVLVNKFSHTRFEPSGYTTNRDIPIAKSLMDYIFRWFDIKFHPNGDNGHFGKSLPTEDVDAKKASELELSLAIAQVQATLSPANTLSAAHQNGASNGNLADAQASLMQSQADSPPCPNCGAITVRSGSCYKCNECGTTTGCG
ncbi:ribonucleoside-diphosphate reductase class II [Abditibacterium utsteinense]|uniref:Vitamin B12-dependent ribonucleotide reductase n=1 Tax=Abditibacterium utsteinense TaxID=1960156 RepID=A0A2S8SWS7_9BACT|nr:vitamin B12-dependent ribonucleotide reductase [Abditibacterium utsteinense]PQV65255.1 ribonucleoside-diphosphate reductase class II [Abditibacterium utsteinense]